jgi:hypothetical protein
MKKILTAGLFILWSIPQLHAQVSELNKINYTADASFLLQKSKKQRTAGWILLGGGIALCYASVINAFGEDHSGDNDVYNPSEPVSTKITAEEIMAYAGAGAIISSVPLFIAGNKNKRKAKLLIKNGTVFTGPRLYLKQQFISLQISL